MTNKAENSVRMRPLEMAVAYGDGTWRSGLFIEVPDNTPEEELNEVAFNEVLKRITKSQTKENNFVDVAHCWIYNSMEDDLPE